MESILRNIFHSCRGDANVSSSECGGKEITKKVSVKSSSVFSLSTWGSFALVFTPSHSSSVSENNG